MATFDTMVSLKGTENYVIWAIRAQAALEVKGFAYTLEQKEGIIISLDANNNMEPTGIPSGIQNGIINNDNNTLKPLD